MTKTNSEKPVKDAAKQVSLEAALPLPVLVAAEQPPIPMVQIAPDGVTPVPIAALGIAENTAPGASAPVPDYVPAIEPASVAALPERLVTQNPNQPPMPVIIAAQAPQAPGATVARADKVSLSPTTTEQQDITTEGQRAINKIWENTQSWIALMVVISGVLTNSIVILFVIFLNKEVTVTQLSMISISLQFINLTTGIVIGFYFSRTNHSAQGGIGPKAPDAPYTGR